MLKLNSAQTLSSIATSVLLCSGCASIVGKSDYPVSLNSSPPGAEVRVSDEQGTEIFRGTTPTIAVLRSGDGYFSAAHYSLHFSGESSEERTTMLSPAIDPWYIGNLIFGSLIGFLIVDPATGAMFKLPDSVTVSVIREGTPIVLSEALIDELRRMQRSLRKAEKVSLDDALSAIHSPPTTRVKSGGSEELRWERDGVCLLSLEVSNHAVRSIEFED